MHDLRFLELNIMRCAPVLSAPYGLIKNDPFPPALQVPFPHPLTSFRGFVTSLLGGRDRKGVLFNQAK
jgi:hypothetical protein